MHNSASFSSLYYVGECKFIDGVYDLEQACVYKSASLFPLSTGSARVSLLTVYVLRHASAGVCASLHLCICKFALYNTISPFINGKQFNSPLIYD